MLLLPIVAGIGRAIWRTVYESSGPTWWSMEYFFPWMAAGAVLGSGVLIFFGVPVRTYVASHELTHALWVKMCGGKVRQLRIKSDSGYIISDCNNFLVTLAPYVFPFYAWIAWCVSIGAFLIYREAWIQKAGWVTIGMALAFHFYFLGKVIFTKQSDFKSQGYFFSYVVVLIGNGLLILAICVLQKSFAQEIKMFFWDVADSYRASFFWIKHLLERG